MWAAALVAAAFTADGVTDAISVARHCIPEQSRLHAALTQVIADHEFGIYWEQTLGAIHRRHDHYNRLHAIPNACLVTAGLLWGAGDFTRTIALTVRSGCDTDSNDHRGLGRRNPGRRPTRFPPNRPTRSTTGCTVWASATTAAASPTWPAERSCAPGGRNPRAP